MTDIPNEIINEYRLHDKAIDGWVYFKVMRGMYGLPQAGLQQPRRTQGTSKQGRLLQKLPCLGPMEAQDTPNSICTDR
jgi:hypothetical protein